MKELSIIYSDNQPDAKQFIKDILYKSKDVYGFEIIVELDELNFSSIINYQNEELKIIWVKCDLDDSYNKVDFWLEDGYKLVQFSNEPYDKENQNRIADLIKNCIMWFDYSQTTIFNFIGKIFFDILTKHKLINGNKRLATALLFYLLEIFGYVFKKPSQWNEHESVIIEFAKESQGSIENKDRTYKKVCQWISDNWVIDLSN